MNGIFQSILPLDYAYLESLDLPVSVVPVIQDRSLDVVFQNAFERTDHVTEDNCDVMMSLDLGVVQVDGRESQVSEWSLNWSQVTSKIDITWL